MDPSPTEPIQPPQPNPPAAPDAPDPIEPRVPPSEPADAWALEKAREELATWRDRAAKAEELAVSTAARAKELEATLSQTRAAIDAAERSRRIDQELMGEGAIDLETARLVAESTLARSPDADIAKAVRDLRRRKPFLFRSSGISGGTLAPARPADEPHARDSIEDLSQEARTSGDRMALLRYLRVKRGV